MCPPILYCLAPGLDPEPDPVAADEPQAATVMAAPRSRLPPSSRCAEGRR